MPRQHCEPKNSGSSGGRSSVTTMELDLPPTAFHPHPQAIEFEAPGPSVDGSGATAMEPGDHRWPFNIPPADYLMLPC